MRHSVAIGLVGMRSSASFSLALVAMGATLFGTEGLLRRPLLDTMSVTSIVFAEYLLLALFALPMVLSQRHQLARLNARTWGLLALIGVGASGLAAVLFTRALETGNPTTASLLQNMQPLFVVLLAMLLLKERLSRLYWPCLAIACTGAYLLSFGAQNTLATLGRSDLIAAAFALSAAALWAGGTVLARLVLSDLSYVTLTAVRILFALAFLIVLAIAQGATSEAFSGLVAHPLRIGAAALIPGLLGILLFYRGLRGTKASYAVLAEFMYPAAALVGNWLVLGTLITPLQAAGCLLLVATIVALSRMPVVAPAPRPAHAERRLALPTPQRSIST